MFKVQKSYSGALRFDDSYRVKRICSDEAILKACETVRFVIFLNFIFVYVISVCVHLIDHVMFYLFVLLW